ncbi:hypothetical protein BB559_001461 [Furculomyces boomerangus]|uniref:Rho-GAP domain-containing protein n=2 Tax=Harpellales TaxID=61421 RepID=A0A2T9Z1W6_9FUNG|nr:hypothetical protein BB559_001461 [Furculomyces boomerangus]PWA01761.1 hypothetical protein BB558_002106 [Smittium angustum]PWA03106.1 hypothetical protein BB558_000723 [Smittium angustum]
MDQSSSYEEGIIPPKPISKDSPETKISIKLATENHSEIDQDEILNLSNIKGSVDILLERSRQSLASCRETALFLKKRASTEDEYSRNLHRTAVSTSKSLEKTTGRVDSFLMSWQRAMDIHEQLASNRTKFSLILSEMSEDLTNYVKEKEKIRKQLKDTEIQYSKAIDESEQSLEKYRIRYETQSAEWEKSLIRKAERMDVNQNKNPPKSKNMGTTVTGIFRQNKSLTAEALERMEQEARVKAKIANEQYKSQLVETNKIRNDYYKYQLPKILMTVRMFVEEIDNALKWHLGKYSYAYECTILSDALTVKPNDKDGLMDIVSGIDNVSDLKNFLSDWSTASRKIENKTILYNEYKMSPAAHYLANRKQVFGVVLSEHLLRDNIKIPPVLIKCAEIVELHGLQNEGIYRISGQNSAVIKLKNEFDFDPYLTNLDGDNFVGDINSITGVLKMYFRELPGSLIPEEQANLMAKILSSPNMSNEENAKAFKPVLSGLPYGHLDTLAYLIKHLNRVQSFQEYNMMSAPNLAIVFGPTLVSTINQGSGIDSFRMQTKIVEFMLNNANSLFPSIAIDGTQQDEINGGLFDETAIGGSLASEVFLNVGDIKHKTNDISSIDIDSPKVGDTETGFLGAISENGEIFELETPEKSSSYDLDLAEETKSLSILTASGDHSNELPPHGKLMASSPKSLKSFKMYNNANKHLSPTTGAPTEQKNKQQGKMDFRNSQQSIKNYSGTRKMSNYSAKNVFNVIVGSKSDSGNISNSEPSKYSASSSPKTRFDFASKIPKLSQENTKHSPRSPVIPGSERDE